MECFQWDIAKSPSSWQRIGDISVQEHLLHLRFCIYWPQWYVIFCEGNWQTFNVKTGWNWLKLLSVTPEKWLSSGNLVLNSAVNGLSDSRTKPVKKVRALDHTYKYLVKPSFISPFMLGSNLVCDVSHCTKQNGCQHLWKVTPWGAI